VETETTLSPSHQLTGHIRGLMRPFADLLVSIGVKYGDAQELLKETFVHAAADQVAEQDGARSISVVSVVSGVHRREVKRLLGRSTQMQKSAPSVASQIFAQWTTNKRYIDQHGNPIPLPRRASDDGPCFDELVSLVNKDVHARSILDELLRIKLIHVDGDLISLAVKDFVPRGDQTQLLGLLALNVGDHLKAASANMQADQFLEQAVFADELTEQSVREVSRSMHGTWGQLSSPLVRDLTTLTRRDAVARGSKWRLRVGMYSYFEPMQRSTSSTLTKLAPQYRGKGRRSNKTSKPTSQRGSS
jgi:hypothetical protein